MPYNKITNKLLPVRYYAARISPYVIALLT